MSTGLVEKRTSQGGSELGERVSRGRLPGEEDATGGSLSRLRPIKPRTNFQQKRSGALNRGAIATAGIRDIADTETRGRRDLQESRELADLSPEERTALE